MSDFDIFMKIHFKSDIYKALTFDDSSTRSAFFKVAEHSFLIPMRYSSFFSNHWQLGSQNWQDTSSAKRDYILICFIALGTVTMATQLVVNQH